MTTFVLMTKMSPQLAADPRGRRNAGKEFMHRVAEKCPQVKWIAHYALLGRYDFMDIFEAPDSETAHKVSYLSLAGGAVQSESWHAMQYEEFLHLIEQ